MSIYMDCGVIRNRVHRSLVVQSVDGRQGDRPEVER
jgi:hypothetical protein